MAATHHALGELHRNAALAQLDSHDGSEDQQRHTDEHDEDDHFLALQERVVRVRQVADNRHEDEHRHAIADTTLADQLTQPHQHRGARNERRNHDQRTWHERVEQHDIGHRGGGTKERRAVALTKDERETGSLQGGNGDSDIAGPLRNLALTYCSLLLPLLEFWNHDGEHLHDDAGGDVRHDAEGEDREAAEGAARKQVQEPECTL